MNALVLTNIGIEDVSAEEIKQLIDVKNVTIKPGRVFFECKTEQDLAKLTYFGRTFTKVMQVLTQFTFTTQPDSAQMPDLKQWLKERAVITCERAGTHPFTSFDMEQEFNKWMAHTYNVQIDRKTPQTIIHLDIVDENCTAGIDYSGIDLGKRDYRIFLGTDALKGNIAAALLFIADYKTEHSLLDPFCRHGIIPIEAALYATNTSPHKFGVEKLAFTKLPITYDVKEKPKEFKGTIIAMDDNFKHVSAARKNAKIAGIVKEVNFSRTDIDWLDAKFGKNFLDRIITLPVQPGRSIAEQTVEKIYHQLFYQAEFILKKTGKVCLCMKRGVELVKRKAEEFKFKVEHERKVMQGAEELTVLVFGK